MTNSNQFNRCKRLSDVTIVRDYFFETESSLLIVRNLDFCIYHNIRFLFSRNKKQMRALQTIWYRHMGKYRDSIHRVFICHWPRGAFTVFSMRISLCTWLVAFSCIFVVTLDVSERKERKHIFSSKGCFCTREKTEKEHTMIHHWLSILKHLTDSVGDSKIWQFCDYSQNETTTNEAYSAIIKWSIFF